MQGAVRHVIRLTREQSGGRKPSVHTHTPSMQMPFCPLQSFGQRASPWDVLMATRSRTTARRRDGKTCTLLVVDEAIR